MADETQTAGTPGTTQEGANAATAASGTPAAPTDGGNAGGLSADERAELEHSRAFKAQALAEKSTLEHAKQELEWYKEREAQAQRGYQPPTAYGYAAPVNPLQEKFQNLAQRDPEAAELFIAQTQGMSQEINAIKAENRYHREVASIPDADRAEAERIAKAENLWPSLAHDRIKARRYEQSQHEIAETRRKLQEQEERMKRNVVRTDAAPAASAPNSEPTQSEYAQIAQRAGQGNPDAIKKMREWDRREETDGPIKFRSG